MRDGDPAGPDGTGADGDHGDDQRSEPGDVAGQAPASCSVI